MNDIKNPIEFSAFLASLKPSIISGSLLLMEMLKDNKKEIIVDKDESSNIVAIIMYDAIIHESVNYSILQDFDVLDGNKIVLKNNDIEQVKHHLEFLLEYLYYRIEAPVDLASC